MNYVTLKVERSGQKCSYLIREKMMDAKEFLLLISQSMKVWALS